MMELNHSHFTIACSSVERTYQTVEYIVDIGERWLLTLKNLLDAWFKITKP